MTNFFVSWTKCEPEFQFYDSECNILISPPLMPKNWTTREWEQYPNKIIVDSGIYTSSKQSLNTVENVFEMQFALVKKFPTERECFFSHPDVIIQKNLSFYDESIIIKSNLKRAYEYIKLLKQKNIFRKPIGVIHGFDPDTVYFSFQELSRMGYEFFGIGSLSIRSINNKSLIRDILSFSSELGIKPLHVFGLTLPFHSGLNEFSINSFDTSTPVKLAYNGTVLYDNPLKRYIIKPNNYQELRAGVYTFRTIIEKPLKCNCPICEKDSDNLIVGTPDEQKKKRMIHNYFQLKWSIQNR